MGGLAYLTSAPTNIQVVIADPIRAGFYLGIIIVFCAVFSLVWLEVGGLGPQKVAQQLMDSGMQIPGYRGQEDQSRLSLSVTFQWLRCLEVS